MLHAVEDTQSSIVTDRDLRGQNLRKESDLINVLLALKLINWLGAGTKVTLERIMLCEGC